MAQPASESRIRDQRKKKKKQRKVKELKSSETPYMNTLYTQQP